MKLLPNVYLKHGAFYYVMPRSHNRKWLRLSKKSDGLPEMYRALSSILHDDIIKNSMSSLVGAWMKEVMPSHSQKTQKDDSRYCLNKKEAFANFRVDQVEAQDIVEAIKNFKNRPRTYNAYRAQIRELMRFAIEKGFRKDNPVEHIKTISTPARDRYITDSELRRIKVAAMYGDDGLKTRSGEMICALIDMAYLTGQRISDLLSLEWSQITKKGIKFKTQKTGASILIEWTPKLTKVIERLKLLKKENCVISDYIFINKHGDVYKYFGASTAFKRAVKRSGITNVTFHDIRAKAITDLDREHGIIAAQRMGGHTTQQQTSDYVRHKGVITSTATK